MTFTYHTPDSSPEGSKHTLTEAQTHFGFVPNLIRVLAESPGTLEAYNKIFEIFFHKTSLSMLECQIVLMTVSFENKSAYCMSTHSWGLEMTKVDSDLIKALRNGEKLSDQKLESLRVLTKELVKNQGRPQKETLDSFLRQGYSERHLLDLLTGIATTTISNYADAVAGIKLDEVLLAHKWEA